MTTLTQASRQWATRPDDERFTSLYDLQDHVHAIRNKSMAGVVSSRNIEFRPDESDTMNGLAVYGPNGHGYNPTHWSFGQLASLAKAPAGYLRTLAAPIAADCLNYGMKFNREVEEVGLLVYRDEEAQEFAIRAATGPNYGRIWNTQIADQLVQRFGDGVHDTDWRVPGEFGRAVEVTKANTTLYASDRDMFVFLADEKNKIEMPNRRNGQPGMLSRGFFLFNSEVGSQSIGAAFFLFDYTCSNRMVWGAEQFKEIRLRHTKGAPDRWLEQIQPVLVEYANAATKPILETIEAARSKRIEDAKSEFLSKRFTVSLANAINAAHEREEGRPVETLWDAVAGLTAHAKSVQWQDQRVALEREAGKLLALAV